jgi:hypothetical protein
MKRQHIQGLTLPPDVAAEQEQRHQMQAQIAGMRNGMALEIYSRAVANYIQDIRPEDLESEVNNPLNTTLPAYAAYALMAAMVFMETAGMIRRESESTLQS